MSWKVTLPCTRAEAEAIDGIELDLDAALMTTEEVEDDVEHWRLDAYFEAEPDPAALAVLRQLVAADAEPTIEQLADADWVTLSQAGLEPIREGRFVVHTAARPVDALPKQRVFRIEAGQAFGTGHHQTTAGCLAMLDGLGYGRFENVVDLGTGTGLLAFAAREMWPEAQVMATDIDPLAIAVARENAAANGVVRIAFLVADGARDPRIGAAAPFDLVIANILAGPLIAMAPEIAAVAAPEAQIVLAGLLATQFDAVTQAYAARGCLVEEEDRRGDWSIVRLRAPAEPVNAGPGGRGDRGAWVTDGR